MASQAYAAGPEDEFWYNVSTQEELPIAGEIELSIDLDSLGTFFSELASQAPELAEEFVASQLRGNSQLFDNIRQFLGVSNKRAYLELSYLASRTKHPTRDTGLCGCYPWTLSRHPMEFFVRLLDGNQGPEVAVSTARMVSDYLCTKGLLEAATGFSMATRTLMELVFERLISPKEIQQKAAKRRGHGCEAELARVAVESGAIVIPESRATNPMGANDPHVDLVNMLITSRVAGKTHAFDLVLSDSTGPRVLCQSLIHTSDPGQYGVDKSNETVAIKREIDKWNNANPSRQIELWALVDGVGFSENKPDTINKIIRNVDHFVQLKTLYKVPLRLHRLGLIKIEGIRFAEAYTQDDILGIKAKYVDDDVIVFPSIPSRETLRKVSAGLAEIYVRVGHDPDRS